MQVPTTPTFSDSMLEHRKLKEDIAVLKIQKTKEEGEFKQWAEAKKVIESEFGALVNLDQTKEEISHMLIQSLISQKDGLVKEIEIHNTKKEKVISEKIQHASEDAALTSKIETKTIQLKGIESNIEQKTREFNTTHSNNSSIIESENKTLALIKQEKVSASTELEMIREEVRVKTDFILKEEVRLGIKARDLAIWEGRIRRKHAELYPGQILNL